MIRNKFYCLMALISLIFMNNGVYANTNNTNSGQKHAKTGTHASHKESSSKSAFPQQRQATGVSTFIFDPKIRQWAVYDKSGTLIKTGRGSGGRDYCPDIHRRCHTPVGEFKVYDQQGHSCKSKKFPVGRGGAPMPYCSYFHGGFAVHGSYDVRSYNASHGCIRIYPEDAQWLQSVIHPGSSVIVEPY